MTSKPAPRKKKADVQSAPPIDANPEAVPATPFDQFLEHQRKALVEAGKALEILLIPAGVKEHGAAALKEAAEGFQKLFNSAHDEFVEILGARETTEAPES